MKESEEPSVKITTPPEFAHVNAVFTRELHDILSWRVPLIGLIVAILSLTFVLKAGAGDIAVILWAVSAVVMGLTVVGLFRASTLLIVFHWQLYFFLATIILLVVPAVIHHSRFAAHGVLLGVVLATLLPWPFKHAVKVMVISTVLILAVATQSSNENLLALTVIIPTIFLFSNLVVAKYADFIERVTMQILANGATVLGSGPTLLRLVTYSMSEYVGAAKAFILWDRRKLEKVALTIHESEEICVEDKLEIVQPIIEELNRQSEQQIMRMLPISLKENFAGRYLFSARYRLAEGEKEHEAWILLSPHDFGNWRFRRRLGNGLRIMATYLYSTLTASRRGVRSLTNLAEIEQTLGKREHEIKTVVHKANNILQELFERVRQLDKCEVDGKSEIEGLLRYLGFVINDIILLRELQLGSFSEAQDVFSLISVKQELIEFCEVLCKQKEVPLVVSIDDDLKKIIINNAQLVFTGIRAVINELVATRPNNMQLKLSNSSRGVVLAISTELNIGPNPLLTNVTALLRVSSGSVEKYDRECRFVFAHAPDNLVQTPNKTAGWFLLVDDQPEIVKFYGKAAKALGYEGVECQTIPAAIEALNKQVAIPPSLVCTDLQLGEESGVELVGIVTAKFGGSVPIIVVSGAISEDARTNLQAVGPHVTLLSKPISRDRIIELFRTRAT